MVGFENSERDVRLILKLAVFEKIDPDLKKYIEKATEKLVPTGDTSGYVLKNRGGVGGC
jgi:hypothetical protein